ALGDAPARLAPLAGTVVAVGSGVAEAVVEASAAAVAVERRCAARTRHAGVARTAAAVADRLRLAREGREADAARERHADQPQKPSAIGLLLHRHLLSVTSSPRPSSAALDLVHSSASSRTCSAVPGIVRSTTLAA